MLKLFEFSPSVIASNQLKVSEHSSLAVSCQIVITAEKFVQFDAGPVVPSVALR